MPLILAPQLIGSLGYRANAVNFDGTNDNLTRGADLSSNADGKLGIASVFVKYAGGDGSLLGLIETGSGIQRIFERLATNKFRTILSTSVPATLADIASTNTFTSSSGWLHLLMGWDLNTGPTLEFYINDVDEKAVTTLNAGTLDYTRTEHWIGARSGPANRMNGDVADLYVNYDETLDFSVEANRRKFIDANGKPVNLGADGSKPTGTAPIMFFSGSTANWHINKGSGGGFTEVGALTTASTSPSD